VTQIITDILEVRIHIDTSKDSLGGRSALGQASAYKEHNKHRKILRVFPVFGPQFRSLDTSDKRCHFVAIKQQNNITYVRRQEDILTASYILYIYQYSPSPGSNLNQGQTESETGAQNHSIAKFSTTKDVSKCVAAQCGSIKLSHFCQYDICFLSSGPHATFVYGGTVEQRLIELPSLLY
jgi:hypothetical protein